MLAWVVALFLVSWCSGLAVPGDKLEGKISEMDACSDGEKLPVTQSEIYFVKSKEKEQHYLGRGNIDIDETIFGPVTVTLQAYKCKELKKVDTCEIYLTYDGEGCDQLAKKKGTLYDLMQKTNSNVTACPITPRHVNFKDMEFFLSDDKALMAYEQSKFWYAKIILTGKLSEDGETKQVMCTHTWLAIDKQAADKKHKFG